MAKPSVSVTVDMSQATKLFGLLARLVSREAKRKGLEVAGDNILDHMRPRTPVLTGATLESEDNHIEELGFGKMVNEVGPETEYAIYPEFGTSTQPPQRFVSGASEGREVEITKIMVDATLREAGLGRFIKN